MPAPCTTIMLLSPMPSQQPHTRTVASRLHTRTHNTTRTRTMHQTHTSVYADSPTQWAVMLLRGYGLHGIVRSRAVIEVLMGLCATPARNHSSSTVQNGTVLSHNGVPTLSVPWTGCTTWCETGKLRGERPEDSVPPSASNVGMRHQERDAWYCNIRLLGHNRNNPCIMYGRADTQRSILRDERSQTRRRSVHPLEVGL